MFEEEQLLARFSNPKTVDSLSELVPQLWNVLLPSGLHNSFPSSLPRNEYAQKCASIHTLTLAYKSIMFQLSFLSLF